MTAAFQIEAIATRRAIAIAHIADVVACRTERHIGTVDTRVVAVTHAARIVGERRVRLSVAAADAVKVVVVRRVRFTTPSTLVVAPRAVDHATAVETSVVATTLVTLIVRAGAVRRASAVHTQIQAAAHTTSIKLFVGGERTRVAASNARERCIRQRTLATRVVATTTVWHVVTATTRGTIAATYATLVALQRALGYTGAVDARRTVAVTHITRIVRRTAARHSTTIQTQCTC